MILPDSDETWQRAAEIIAEGGLVVFPTDTVYGVGCDPYNVAAIEKVFEAKSRSHLKALPLLLSDSTVLGKVTEGANPQVRALCKQFWPGALTIVFEKAANLPDELGSETTVAVRVPDHDGLRRFIGKCGGAIAATSANLSGQPDALDAQQGEEYLGERVQLVVDGGRVRGGVPSTVVDCTGDKPVVLRAGAIAEDSIKQVWDASGRMHGK
jgi:tRNA threonylcarbamoyl adenosine modification protein (Sua5/YciO/YrdC/YwlC family)